MGAQLQVSIAHSRGVLWGPAFSVVLDLPAYLGGRIDQAGQIGSELGQHEQVTWIGIARSRQSHYVAVSYTHLTLPTIYSV